MKKILLIIASCLLFFSTPVEATEIIGIEPINQHPQLPTGCEATALTMLIQWAGVDITKEQVADTYQKGSNPVYKNGRLEGANPEVEFVGSPYNKSSFGVYEKPTLQVLETFIPKAGYNLTGKPFKEIEKFIDNGKPVMIWGTIKMLKPYVSVSWYDKEGTKVDWMANEHAMLMVGYTDTHIIVNDPYTGKRESYPRDLFLQRWEQIGKRAISIETEEERIVAEKERIAAEEERKKPMKDMVNWLNLF